MRLSDRLLESGQVTDTFEIDTTDDFVNQLVAWSEAMQTVRQKNQL